MTRDTTMVAVQAVGALAALAALAFRPPQDGLMLLVPLTQGARASLVSDVVAGGGAIVAPGPLPGSLVVVGTRARLADAGRLLVAAPPALCGQEPGR